MERAEGGQRGERNSARMLDAAPRGSLRELMPAERWPQGLEERSREMGGSWKRKGKDVSPPAGGKADFQLWSSDVEVSRKVEEMLLALRLPPVPLHAPCPGTMYLWRQGRPWVANEHAKWGGVG